MLRRLLPVLCLLSLVACDGSDGDNSKDGRDSGDTDSTDTDEPASEADCSDGADNDDDGSIDCADSDCAAEFVCSWPDTMSHRTDIFFDGYTVECETWLGTFEEEVDDCRTNITAPLSVATDGDICPKCDRTYVGPFTYENDNCDDLTGDGERPTEGRFGFVFISETERELWSQDDLGAWAPAVTMALADGIWSYADGGEIEVANGDCDNSPLTVGMLTVTLSFVDPQG
ncbi:MAG: hypothetical protein ACI8S6_003061 [Myxococcota bacterium]|jgi:hypothetical protein